MKSRVTAACIAAMLALSSSGLAQDAGDDALAVALAGALRSDRRLTIFDDVSGHVDGSTVVLTGRVTTSHKKLELERQVADLAGVSGVRNQVTVLPTSVSDDDLRYRISRAIYGSPSFWAYAAMGRPPIRIIVENGHVTLAGKVNNHVERTMAGSLASGFGARSVANELRTNQR